ncbi:hypothetical protein B0H17DRAFT_1201082 [Mycena rosella]|uniref:DUF6534 domain-containing protein n=1 Tax=Mycena rosella TaxID=1033263 RepID=A0AAD7GHR2_MYCRO|nr:hypothetical protein B0H17DRAFT_1201082 [Mycena rosella]
MAGVDLLFGPLLIGVLLNMTLYGVMATQMLTYYQRYANDFAWIRYFMLYLFIVESTVVIVQVGIIFQPLIIDYGALKALVFAPKMLPGDSFLIAIVSGPIQMFAAWRIKVITESYIIPAFVSLLALASGSSGIAMFVTVLQTPEFRDFDKFKTVATMWLVCSAACDILIAGGMSYALLTRKTGFSMIDGHINQIVRLTIETGSLTAIFALVNVMLFLVFPFTTLNFIVAFPRPNVYTCSVLAIRPSMVTFQVELTRTHEDKGCGARTDHHHHKIQSSMIYRTSNEKVLETPPPMPLEVHVRQVVQLDTSSRNQY